MIMPNPQPEKASEDEEAIVGYDSDEVKVEYPNPLGRITEPEGDFKFFISEQSDAEIIRRYHKSMRDAILDYKYLTSKALVDRGIRPYGFSLDLLEATINFYWSELEKWEKKNEICLLGLEGIVRVDEKTGNKFTLIRTRREFMDLYNKRQILRKTLSKEEEKAMVRNSAEFRSCIDEAELDFRKCVENRHYILISGVNGDLKVEELDDYVLKTMEDSGFYGLMELDKKAAILFKRIYNISKSNNHSTPAQPLCA